MANFLTYGNSFCFHEALIETKPDGMKELFESLGKETVGNSDCGNILFLDEILDVFPDTKLVMIERPLEEVLLSLNQMGTAFSNTDSVVMCHGLMNQIKETYNPLVFDFHQMDESACRVLWDYCTGEPFDYQRWKTLNGLNIEIIPDMKINQIINEGN